MTERLPPVLGACRRLGRLGRASSLRDLGGAAGTGALRGAGGSARNGRRTPGGAG